VDSGSWTASKKGQYTEQVGALRSSRNVSSRQLEENDGSDSKDILEPEGFRCSATLFEENERAGS